MIEALERVAGKKAVDLIEEQPDQSIIDIVKNWPRQFNAERAESLGFQAEKTFDEIIQAHIDDELDGQLPG